jgi:iron(III) transport system substrate-binding protein
MKRRHLQAALLVVVSTLVIAGCGSTSTPSASRATAADLALYEGQDRTQRLIEGAKREGEITIYTSAQTTDLGPVVEAYEKKYGIKASIWRAGSEAVLNRALQEARAGRHTVDIVETNGPELESLSREQILQLVKSPYHADLIAPAIRPHGEWVGTRLNVFVQAYNTKLVKKEELPKTWDDLTDPRWKGRLGIEQEDSDWLAGIYGEIGEERASKVFRQITAANGVSVRKGHTLLTQLVASGEVPLALTVYNYKAEQLRREGAPIDWFTIGNAIARPNGVGLAKQAPHPHAALLFYDFELSEEGQKIIADREFVPTSRKVDTPLNKVPMTFVDARVSIDEYDKWKNLYTDLFGAGF